MTSSTAPIRREGLGTVALAVLVLFAPLFAAWPAHAHSGRPHSHSIAGVHHTTHVSHAAAHADHHPGLVVDRGRSGHHHAPDNPNDHECCSDGQHGPHLVVDFLSTVSRVRLTGAFQAAICTPTFFVDLTTYGQPVSLAMRDGPPRDPTPLRTTVMLI